jgi:molecular chaperone GrpE
MIEDKDDRAPGMAPANDAGEFPDEGAGPSPEERAVVALEAELADTKDRLLRALAETENVRRRGQRARATTTKYESNNITRALPSAAHMLYAALDSVPEAEILDPRAKSLLDGVAATERELLGAFERHGLKRIDPKGERFDHNFHQAIFEAERPGAKPGTVIEVLQPGYVLHDRLLRPAMVGVAKAGSPPPDDGTDDAA